jgi:hypothetical protein
VCVERREKGRGEGGGSVCCQPPVSPCTTNPWPTIHTHAHYTHTHTHTHTHAHTHTHEQASEEEEEDEEGGGGARQEAPAAEPENTGYDDSAAALALVSAERGRGLGQDEGTLGKGDEVDLGDKTYWWHDKHRPRKPRYFNRVGVCLCVFVLVWVGCCCCGGG